MNSRLGAISRGACKICQRTTFCIDSIFFNHFYPFNILKTRVKDSLNNICTNKFRIGLRWIQSFLQKWNFAQDLSPHRQLRFQSFFDFSILRTKEQNSFKNISSKKLWLGVRGVQSFAQFLVKLVRFCQRPFSAQTAPFKIIFFIVVSLELYWIIP